MCHEKELGIRETSSRIADAPSSALVASTVGIMYWGSRLPENPILVYL